MKIIRFLITTFTLFSLVLPFTIDKTNAQTVAPTTTTSDYSVSFTSNKTSIKPGEEIILTLKVTNTSNRRINNFEVRVPYIRFIRDATLQGESPSFNKVLDSIEYPDGFNNRSWLINTFDPDETQTYTLKYRISAEPKYPNGLITTVTLPGGWVDPDDLESGKLLDLEYTRADIYINRQYKSSSRVRLPKLESLSTPISLVTLNPKYTFTGSKTTNLKTITPENIKAFPNFTLESEDLIIEWLTPVDFSSPSAQTQLSALDTNLKTQWGLVGFNPSNLPFLANKQVRVTFKNANFLFPPKIKVLNVTKDIKEEKAAFDQGTKLLAIEMTKLQELSIVPEITLSQAVYETDEETIDVKGKVSDPSTPISYKVNGETKTLSGIDLSTGEFSFPISVKDEIQEVEISTKYSNGEETKKIAIVKKIASNTIPEEKEESGSGKISDPFNTITIGLILAAVGLLSILGGFIYFLYRGKGNKKPSKELSDLNPVVINKVGAIGTKPENIRSDEDTNSEKENSQLEKPSNKVDLNSLRDKYVLPEDQSNTNKTVKD